MGKGGTLGSTSSAHSESGHDERKPVDNIDAEAKNYISLIDTPL